MQKLQTLSFSSNQIAELPVGIEELMKLEVLIMNDNKVRHLPLRIGLLQNLKKFLFHNNQIATIPTEFGKLMKLNEFSSEWFIYLNPPMPKIMKDAKGQLMLDQVRQFCRSFNPPNITNT